MASTTFNVTTRVTYIDEFDLLGEFIPKFIKGKRPKLKHVDNRKIVRDAEVLIFRPSAFAKKKMTALIKMYGDGIVLKTRW